MREKRELDFDGLAEQLGLKPEPLEAGAASRAAGERGLCVLHQLAPTPATLIVAKLDAPLFLGLVLHGLTGTSATALVARHAVDLSTNDPVLARSLRQEASRVLAEWMPRGWVACLLDDRVELEAPEHVWDADALRSAITAATKTAGRLAALRRAAPPPPWKAALVNAWKEAAQVLGAMLNEEQLSLSGSRGGSAFRVEVVYAGSQLTTRLRFGSCDAEWTGTEQVPGLVSDSAALVELVDTRVPAASRSAYR